jgi:hypothetical protein
LNDPKNKPILRMPIPLSPYSYRTFVLSSELRINSIYNG